MTHATMTSHDNAAALVTGKTENCWRCSGTGRIDAFAHVQNGVCFGCGGTGAVKAGQAGDARDGVWTFQIDGLVWQFYGINHGDLNPGSNGVDYTVHQKVTAKATGHYRRIDSVMFQAFPVGANRRRGTTLLHARVTPEVARKVWRDAAAGVKPETMTDEYLGIKAACSRSRNTRGVNVF